MLTTVLSSSIVRTVFSIVLVMVSAIIHEVSHGLMAYKLGDPTAKQAGRLTLNPLAHLDPVGSVLLPILMGLAGGPVLSFAKPVPYNPRNLRNPVRDEVLVALAGPASNLAQALVGAGIFRLIETYGAGMSMEVWYILLIVLSSYVYVNLVLMCFNLIPFPPLDGSAIIFPLLKGEARQKYYEVQRYAMPVLLVVMYVLPTVLHIDPVGAYLDVTAGNLYMLLLGA